METIRTLERQCKALANARRLTIIRTLKGNNDGTVGDIARAIHLSFRSTSKHLGILERAGILERRPRGIAVFYRLSRDQPAHVRSLLNVL